MAEGPPAQDAWPPREATEKIRAKARGNLDLSYTRHFSEQLELRGLVMGDALHVLANGFVYEEAQPATLHDHFKYRIEGRSPNSGARTLRLVVIPSPVKDAIKIITVMWRDES